MKEKVTLSFAGNEITVISAENEDYLKNLAKILDRRIGEMVIVKNRCTKTEAIMLCALDYLDSTVKLERENDALKKKIEELEATSVKKS